MVVFNKEKHSYTNPTSSLDYCSVTSLINSFKEVFDLEKQSRIVAEREGVSQDEIKKRWNTIKVNACNFGTNLHSKIEENIESKGVLHLDDELVKKFISFSNINYKKALSETIVYSHEYRVAGTSDIIIDNDKTFDILDLKTNKNFRFSSKFNKNMLHPVEHLPECEYSIYSLQVSMYAYLYHCMTGKTVGSLFIYWFDRETNDYHRYPVLYLYNDVKSLLEEYKRRGFKK